MISDVLSDALDDIAKYLQDQPDVYAHLADELAIVTTLMDAMLISLDAAQPDADPLVLELRTAIRTLDVAPIMLLMEKIKAKMQERRST
jgi:hypothetical protein